MPFHYFQIHILVEDLRIKNGIPLLEDFVQSHNPFSRMLPQTAGKGHISYPKTCEVRHIIMFKRKHQDGKACINDVQLYSTLSL